MRNLLGNLFASAQPPVMGTDYIRISSDTLMVFAQQNYFRHRKQAAEMIVSKH